MCDCKTRVTQWDKEICVACGEVYQGELDDRDWHRHQGTVYNKGTPYKYSRTTHFRNTLNRTLGWSRVDPQDVADARRILTGYPDNYECAYLLLKKARLPYQHTDTIRRALGKKVPDLDAKGVKEINALFEKFCTFYETRKAAHRKNLPSIEYLIYNFLLYMDREDIAGLICKRYMTPEKQDETDEVIKDFFT